MTNDKTMRSKAFSNMSWRFGERILAQLINFIVQIILARVLLPKEFGTISLVLVFIQILQVFVDSGLGNALIQKKDADDIDFSTVFYFNIIWCLILYLIAFMIAPFIAAFYKDESLTAIFRVLSVTVIISGVKNVQQAYVSKTLQFKKFFWSTLGGTLFSAFLGITMVMKGFGVWSLVGQYLSNLLIDTLVLWITVQWRPIRAFDIGRLKGLFSFGWKLLLSGLLDTIYNNLRQLFIGKLYTSSDLAFYNRGDQFPNTIVTNINTSIDSVLLPIMSGAQDNLVELKAMTRRSIKTSCFLLAPLMMGLAFTAETVVSIVLTDKWLPCVFYLRIFCISYMFWPIHTSNLNALKAMGRSDLFLRLEILKKVVGMIALFSTAWISVEAMAYSLLFTSVASQIINSMPNKKLLHYGYLEQMKDILPSTILAILMGMIIYPLKYIMISKFLILPIQIITGVIIYVVGAKLTKNDSLNYVNSIFKPYLKKLFGKEK